MPAITEDWLKRASTVGSATFNLPTIPNDFDYGFQLPQPPPTTSQEAAAVVNQLLAPGGLPEGRHFNEHADGLRQNRLSFAVMKLLLQCLDVWADDQANAAAATVQSKGRAIRRHQLSPLAVCFKNGGARANSFRAWLDAMEPAVAESAEVADVISGEMLYAGTVDQCTAGHRANSSSLYLVSTKNHQVYELSFALRGTKRLVRDPEVRDAALAHLQDLVADREARDEHTGRGGEDHDVAVYIAKPEPDGVKRVYVFDPAFAIEDWPKPAEGAFVKRRELSNAAMIHRVRELVDHLKDGSNARDKQLKTARFFIGGGGNEASECRPMSIRWATGIVHTQMMRLRGEDAASEPPEHFAEDLEEVSWVEVRP